MEVQWEVLDPKNSSGGRGDGVREEGKQCHINLERRDCKMVVIKVLRWLHVKTWRDETFT